MSRRRSFVFDMYPQDFMSGVVGLDDATVGVYIKLINLMHMYEGPLPPRSARLHRDEFDEWLRDKLGHKNIRTWLRAKRVLLGDPDKLLELPDGRIVNPRVQRDLAKRMQRPPSEGGGGEGEQGGGNGGGQGGGGQRSLPFQVVDGGVDKPVGKDGETPGQAAVRGNDRPNIEQSSADVRSIRAANPLKSPGSRCVYPYPYTLIPLQVAVVGTRFRARARGDPPGP